MMPCEHELGFRCHEWTEPHGEQCYQEWYECSKCGETLTPKEMEAFAEVEE